MINEREIAKRAKIIHKIDVDENDENILALIKYAITVGFSVGQTEYMKYNNKEGD